MVTTYYVNKGYRHCLCNEYTEQGTCSHIDLAIAEDRAILAANDYARRECLHCGRIVWLRDDEEQRCPDCGWEVE